MKDNLHEPPDRKYHPTRNEPPARNRQPVTKPPPARMPHSTRFRTSPSPCRTQRRPAYGPRRPLLGTASSRPTQQPKLWHPPSTVTVPDGPRAAHTASRWFLIPPSTVDDGLRAAFPASRRFSSATIHGPRWSVYGSRCHLRMMLAASNPPAKALVLHCYRPRSATVSLNGSRWNSGRIYSIPSASYRRNPSANIYSLVGIPSPKSKPSIKNPPVGQCHVSTSNIPFNRTTTYHQSARSIKRNTTYLRAVHRQHTSIKQGGSTTHSTHRSRQAIHTSSGSKQQPYLRPPHYLSASC